MTTCRWGGDTDTGLTGLFGVRAGLISLANGFYRRAMDCQTFEAEYDLTSEFLGEFMARVAEYFRREEELMATYRYPYTEEHIEEHEAFTARLYSLRRRHKRGEPAMSVEIFQAVRDWAGSHVEEEDAVRDRYLERVALPAV